MKRAVVLALLMILASVSSQAMKPTRHLADHKPTIDLKSQVPHSFGQWRVDPETIPVLPAPDVQARLDVLYTQVLARTYVNAGGERVMLSIAYGSDQSSQATAVHRPEFCYAAQGFHVVAVGSVQLDLAGRRLPVRRLVAAAGTRVEPITYWVTVDEMATLPGLGRKLTQLAYGLRGDVPDGMLVRVSSLQRGGERAFNFDLQWRFLIDLSAAVPALVRPRFFGAS